MTEETRKNLTFFIFWESCSVAETVGERLSLISMDGICVGGFAFRGEEGTWGLTTACGFSPLAGFGGLFCWGLAFVSGRTTGVGSFTFRVFFLGSTFFGSSAGRITLTASFLEGDSFSFLGATGLGSVDQNETIKINQDVHGSA